MFEGEKYLTAGVDCEIPKILQIFMWDCIANLPVEKDYLQVFKLSKTQNGFQRIIHSQEQPEYKTEYMLVVPFEAVDAKIFVIDDYFEDENKHISTMLLAEEY